MWAICKRLVTFVETIADPRIYALRANCGYGPKSVGAICDPSAFTAVVELAPSILGPRDGQITVDLVEPNCQPIASPWTKIVERRVFQQDTPFTVQPPYTGEIFLG
jgi:hypothetical protein